MSEEDYKNPHTGSSFDEFLEEERLMEPAPNGFAIDEVKLTRIKLEPGEILSVRISSDSVDEMQLAMLKRQLTSLFPNNRIMLFCLPKGDTMDMEAISREAFRTDEELEGPYAEAAQKVSSCAEPTSYCNDCHCGKKERIESEGEE